MRGLAGWWPSLRAAAEPWLRQPSLDSPDAALGPFRFTAGVFNVGACSRGLMDHFLDGGAVEDTGHAPAVGAGGDGTLKLHLERRAGDAQGDATADASQEPSQTAYGDTGGEGFGQDPGEGQEPIEELAAVVPSQVVAGLAEDGLGVRATEYEPEQVGHVIERDPLPSLARDPVPVDLALHHAGEPEPARQAGGEVLVLQDLRGPIVLAHGLQDRERQVRPEPGVRILRRLYRSPFFL